MRRQHVVDERLVADMSTASLLAERREHTRIEAR
jgi:hypothetical protein